MLKATFVALIAALTVPCMLTHKVTRPGNSDEDCAKLCTDEKEFSCIDYHHDSGVCYLSSEDDRGVSTRRTVQNVEKEQQDFLSLKKDLEARLKAMENKVFNQQTTLNVPINGLEDVKTELFKKPDPGPQLNDQLNIRELKARLTSIEEKLLHQQAVQTELVKKLQSFADADDNTEVVESAKMKAETTTKYLKNFEEKFVETSQKLKTALTKEDLTLTIETKDRVWSAGISFSTLIKSIILVVFSVLFATLVLISYSILSRSVMG